MSAHRDLAGVRYQAFSVLKWLSAFLDVAAALLKLCQAPLGCANPCCAVPAP